MFCANCGKELQIGAKFCAHCGHKNLVTEFTAVKQQGDKNLNNVNVPISTNSSNIGNICGSVGDVAKTTPLNIANRSRNIFPAWIVLAVIVLIVIVGIAFFLINNNSKPEDTARTFFENVKSGNVEKAIDCMSPEIKNQWNLGMGLANALGSKLGLSGSSSLLNSFIGLSDSNAYSNYEFKVQSASYSGENIAKVPVDVYINGNKQETTTLEMKKIDNKWYISK